MLDPVPVCLVLYGDQTLHLPAPNQTRNTQPRAAVTHGKSWCCSYAAMLPRRVRQSLHKMQWMTRSPRLVQAVIHCWPLQKGESGGGKARPSALQEWTEV